MMDEMRGLTSAEAAARLAKNGPNELTEKKVGTFAKIAHSFVSPASLMLVAAAGLSFFIGHLFDGFFILALLILNVGMMLWHSHKADRALDALKARLSVSARVRRDDEWRDIPSREVVQGDLVECGVGALIPADLVVDSEVNLTINEAVLTGESMPKSKKRGDTAYSGSVVMTGMCTGTVTATGDNAFFGTIARSAQVDKRSSSFERDIVSITRFLIIASLIAVAILTTVFILGGESLSEIALLDLSLLIAGLPVSLPTVMTLIISIGALGVASKNALVRRLSSLEDFANVTLLLTDKTGTLTENKISVERVMPFAPFGEQEARGVAAAAAAATPDNLIDRAIVAAGDEGAGGYTIVQTIPADSTRKRGTTLLTKGGIETLVSFGAPQVIEPLCVPAVGLAEAIARDTAMAARDGSRAIAVAIKERPDGIGDEKDMHFVGMLVLSDPLRSDAAETIRHLKTEGIETVMVTGDTAATASRVVEELGLTGAVVRAHGTDLTHLQSSAFANTAAFAEVLPEDKLKLVSRAQEVATVASTGDGVNDLPALRKADVGIAVANAVAALKGTADIVLLDAGISTLGTALAEARKVFFRLYNYSIYRISESFRLVVTALILGILVKGFPLTPVQLILLAFLNDIPIITLAFDRVTRADRPADLEPKERFTLGTLFGIVGIMNSIIFYFLLTSGFHMPIKIVQTAFFLKLTVSGHMLIYVAHTQKRWWRYLPARSVIIATTITQILATIIAIEGALVAPIPLSLALFVWVWSLFWMQIAEVTKVIKSRMFATQKTRPRSLPLTA